MWDRDWWTITIAHLKKTYIHWSCLAFSNILRKLSILARIKRKGDKGSPCLMPLSREEKPTGLLFTSTKYFMVEKLYLIHLIYFSPNPICLRISVLKGDCISPLATRHGEARPFRLFPVRRSEFKKAWHGNQKGDWRRDVVMQLALPF